MLPSSWLCCEWSHTCVFKDFQIHNSNNTSLRNESFKNVCALYFIRGKFKIMDRSPKCTYSNLEITQAQQMHEIRGTQCK